MHTFGDQLRALRRRVRLSSAELAEAIGYSTAHLTLLELNLRVPDAEPIAALFVPKLGLQTENTLTARLLAAAAELRAEHRVIVRVEHARHSTSTPEPGWWISASADARVLASVLAVLQVPVDIRGAVIADACAAAGKPVDVKAAGRELLELRAIAAPSEAELSDDTRAELLATLNDAERRAAHSAGARICERLHNNFVGALSHVVAAEDVDAASELLFDRAHLIAERSEAAPCAELIDAALKLARRTQPSITTLFRLLATRAELLIGLGRHDEAARSLHEAAELARPPERRAHLLTLLALHALRQNQTSEALEHTTQAIDALTALDTVLLCRTSALQAQALLQSSQIEAAADKAERALWLCDAVHASAAPLIDDARAIACAILGSACRARGQTQLAISYFERAAETAARAGAARDVCHAQLNAAHTLLEIGLADRAATAATAAADAARPLNDTRLTGRIASFLATVSYFANHIAQAERYCLEAAALRRQSGDHSGFIAVQALLVRIAIDRGALDQALALAQRIEDDARDAGDPALRAHVIDTVVLAHLARGELASAHTAFDELRRLLATQRHPALLAAHRNHEALFALLRNLPIEALRLSSAPHAAAAGRDAEWERQVIEGLATSAIGSTDMGARLLDRVAHTAGHEGFGRFAALARRARENQDAGVGSAFFPPLDASTAATVQKSNTTDHISV